MKFLIGFPIGKIGLWWELLHRANNYVVEGFIAVDKLFEYFVVYRCWKQINSNWNVVAMDINSFGRKQITNLIHFFLLYKIKGIIIAIIFILLFY